MGGLWAAGSWGVFGGVRRGIRGGILSGGGRERVIFLEISLFFEISEFF